LALELVEPLLQRLLAEAPVAVQLHVRDAAGARLRPHPVLGDAEALGDIVDGQKAGHRGLSRRRHVAGNLRSAERGEAEKLVPNWYRRFETPPTR
jgi:hypothetical protein